MAIVNAKVFFTNNPCYNQCGDKPISNPRDVLVKILKNGRIPTNSDFRNASIFTDNNIITAQAKMKISEDE